MNNLQMYLAHDEIDRRLRSVDFHRRIRWGTNAPTGSNGPRKTESAGR